MRALAFVLALAPLADPPTREPGAWQDTWKSADPEVYATLQVTQVGGKGFAVVWDENVGIQGAHAEGRATWTGPQTARFESDRCSLTLTRVDGDRLRAQIDEGSCFNWSSHETLTLVREKAVVHQQTSFDCAKAATPVERAICTDRDLAGADRLLAGAFKDAIARDAGARDAIQSAQRAWLNDRDRKCGPVKDPRYCLFEAYGRRALALRAWPRVAFASDGRPDVDALEAVLRDDKARNGTGIRELTAGLVGGIPDEMSFELKEDATGIWLTGCDEPDRSRGFDPHGLMCGRQHYVAFLRNGETWAAWADADGVAIAPKPKKGQRLPASLLDFQENHGPPDDEPDR